MYVRYNGTSDWIGDLLGDNYRSYGSSVLLNGQAYLLTLTSNRSCDIIVVDSDSDYYIIRNINIREGNNVSFTMAHYVGRLNQRPPRGNL